jgi:hypothetical protein
MSIENDISVGKFDIRILGNSTMPSNKWGEWQVYMEAYQMGLIDRVEALKKTDIFDKQGVLQRTDLIQQLQGQVQQQEQLIKDLKGDLQTAHRESIQSRKSAEVEKYKSRLKGEELDSKAKNKISINKLENAVKLSAEKLRQNERSEPQEGIKKS